MEKFLDLWSRASFTIGIFSQPSPTYWTLTVPLIRSFLIVLVLFTPNEHLTADGAVAYKLSDALVSSSALQYSDLVSSVDTGDETYRPPSPFTTSVSPSSTCVLFCVKNPRRTFPPKSKFSLWLVLIQGISCFHRDWFFRTEWADIKDIVETTMIILSRCIHPWLKSHALYLKWFPGKIIILSFNFSLIYFHSSLISHKVLYFGTHRDECIRLDMKKALKTALIVWLQIAKSALYLVFEGHIFHFIFRPLKFLDVIKAGSAVSGPGVVINCVLSKVEHSSS